MTCGPVVLTSMVYAPTFVPGLLVPQACPGLGVDVLGDLLLSSTSSPMREPSSQTPNSVSRMQAPFTVFATVQAVVGLLGETFSQLTSIAPTLSSSMKPPITVSLRPVGVPVTLPV